MHQLDLQNETLVSFNEVPQHLPKRGGKKVHYSTVYRWATKGARGRLLESAIIGGLRYTTLEALQRFTQGKSATAHGDRYRSAVEHALSQAGL